MKNFSALQALCEGNLVFTGGFLSERPVARNFVVFFDPRMNKQLSKPSGRQWFDTPLRSLCCHCYVNKNTHIFIQDAVRQISPIVLMSQRMIATGGTVQTTSEHPRQFTSLWCRIWFVVRRSDARSFVHNIRKFPGGSWILEKSLDLTTGVPSLQKSSNWIVWLKILEYQLSVLFNALGLQSGCCFQIPNVGFFMKLSTTS